MSDTSTEELPCKHRGCSSERVSGSEYCDDHSLQMQVASRHPAPTGTLADLIRNAKKQGLIAPIQSGYVSKA